MSIMKTVPALHLTMRMCCIGRVARLWKPDKMESRSVAHDTESISADNQTSAGSVSNSLQFI